VMSSPTHIDCDKGTYIVLSFELTLRSRRVVIQHERAWKFEVATCFPLFIIRTRHCEAQILIELVGGSSEGGSRLSR
jgi:hypothetical protein